MQQIFIQRKKTESIQRRHPWIFSGAIDTKKTDLNQIEDGSIVTCLGQNNEFLGIGYYSAGSTIAIRILSFVDLEINSTFWQDRFENALILRKLVVDLTTDGYRLIHGEGDGLPGLIIDIYRDSAVIQCHTSGIFKQVEVIASALDNVFNQKLETIYCKSGDTHSAAGPSGNYWIKGDNASTVFKENAINVVANWELGQKTGYYLDQRTNRALAGNYASGKEVLDLFCNVGGFSLNALKSNATQIVAVDASALAIQQLEQNLVNNDMDINKCQLVVKDCLTYLKELDRQFDMVICDPPAFAKNIKKRHNAVQGYKRLNAEAMKAVRSGGILFTFSCSQVVDEELFYNTIVAAGIESGKTIRVLHKLTQGPDHPVNLFHREGSYLKGLVLEISE
jgi:23S rRNA (cytosine1962-C5)-methyltransferase